MKKRTNEYWDERARRRMDKYHSAAESTLRTITAAYNKALRDIEASKDKIFGAFMRSGGLTAEQARRLLNERMSNPMMAEARRILPTLKSPEARRWLLAKMNAAAYKARISRLEAQREMILLYMRRVADVEITANRARHALTIRDAFYMTMYDIQKGLGVGFSFTGIPVKVIEQIIRNPWSGENFSRRIWHNTGKLAKELTDIVTAGFISGAGNREMRLELQQRMDVGKFAANRIIRTETTYMSNAAEMESYEAADIDKYQFIATLDLRTSSKCRAADGKIYETSKARAGVNMPPLHPFCRSTTRAWFGADTLDGIERRARDPKTGRNITVPASMTYEEWYKIYGQNQN